MPKIVFVGAGSTVFAKNLLGDILSMPDLSSSEIVMFDIDPERLSTSMVVAERIREKLEAKAQISSTTNQAKALNGADYVITMFQVGGYEPSTVIDFEIPKKYGLRQTIGDTLGIGGIMRGIRTIPVMLNLVKDMENLCPDALLLNYVNPMAMLCWAIAETSNIKTIGLCHSVQQTAAQISEDISVPFNEIDYLAVGINHMSFFLKYEQHTDKGLMDLYPLIRERAKSQPPYRKLPGGVSLSDAVRYEVLERIGYFVTESSEHFAEYVPWFIKSGREDLIKQFEIPLDEYPRRCEQQIQHWETLRSDLEDPARDIHVRPSNEYGAGIIHSIETGTPRTFNGNVPNGDLITNLPAECCVEVPCRVDGSGIAPTPIGELPRQIAALIQTNINVQSLTVQAVLENKREHIYHAAMVDPHTSAELGLNQIWALVDEMLLAHGDRIPIGLRKAQ
ncbi:MAG: alpha-glucosidase/alpha-galactosidase [Acidimicrobiaceae bacterium]|nr:alpha-glucosidase/alpha-galactosidase [Acidimicrobiaceae bacterium]